MTPIEAIFLASLLFLIACSLPLVICWTVVYLRIEQTMQRLPTGMDGIGLAENSKAPDRPILVVVPAHNEAGPIAPLIRSLREQDHERYRVILALDRCTDATASIARQEIGNDHRFEIIEIDECQKGWAGKVNAVREGIERSAFTSEAEFFLFTDADCLLHPSCLRATAALSENRDLDLLSFINEYPAQAWYESIVQPIAGFELMRQYPLLRANRTDDRQRPFANGQFMLFRAGFYRDMGGHAIVKDELLEDLALAKAVKAKGGRAGALLSGGIVRCRMYETWGDFKRGWRRIYTEAAHRRSRRLKNAAWATRIAGSVLPVLTVVFGATAITFFHLGGASTPLGIAAYAALAAGIGANLAAVARILSIARAPIVLAPLGFMGFWLVSGILFRAAAYLAVGRPTNWGGRSYHRQDRSNPNESESAVRTKPEPGTP